MSTSDPAGDAPAPVIARSATAISTRAVSARAVATRRETARPGIRLAGGERGAVTVETAIALTSFLLVVATVLAGVSATLGQVRCTDAAREAARLLARGDTVRAAVAVREIGPSGSRLSVERDADAITARVDIDDVSELLPGVDISAVAYAVAEPGATNGPR